MKHMQKIFSGRGLRGMRAEPQINSRDERSTWLNHEWQAVFKQNEFSLEVNVFDWYRSLKAMRSEHKLSEELLNRKKKSRASIIVMKLHESSSSTN